MEQRRNLSKKQTIYTMNERIKALEELKQQNQHLSFAIDCVINEIENEKIQN